MSPNNQPEEGAVVSPYQPNEPVVAPVEVPDPEYFMLDAMMDVWKLSFHAGIIAHDVIVSNVPEEERANAVATTMQKLFAVADSRKKLMDVLSSRMMLIGLIAEALELKEIK
jgi:hypothetical protein